MRLLEKLNEMNLSIYKLSLESGIAKSTLNDIFIEKVGESNEWYI